MKHLLHKFSSLRLLMLLAVLLGLGSGAAWADEVTIWSEDFTGLSSLPSSGTNATYAYNTTGASFYATEKTAGGTAPEIMIKKGGGSFSATITDLMGCTDFTLTYYTNQNGNLGVTVNNGASVTASSGSSNPYSKTISLGNANSLTITFTATSSSKNVRLDNIVLTGTKPASTASLSSIALSGTYPITFYQGDAFSHEGMTVTATYEDESTKDVTASAEFTDYDMSTTGNQTVTVSYTEKEVTKTATYDITVNAIPTHTATFSINGNTDNTANFAEGADIIFPNAPADIDGKTFVGWVTSTIDGTMDEAPSFVTSATMGNADITYYAVFAIAEGSGEDGWIETALTDLTSLDVFVFSNGSYAIPTDNGTSNAPAATSITVAEGKITSEVADKLKWNVSGNTDDGYTFYPNGTTETWLYCNTTASSSSNNNIRVGTGNRKVWSVDNNGYLVTNDTYADRYLSLYSSQDFRGYTGTGNGAFVPKFYKLTSGTSYSEYCTTVVAAAVVRPEIVVAANPFLFSTTATITCGTEGAAIKYSFDGENWNDYEDALTITETTTLYAKAVKDETESSVASVTATKNLAEPTLAIDATGITNTNVFDGTEAGSLAAAVTYNDAAVEGAIVTWSGNNDEVATIDAATGAVTLVEAGTVTFTATYAGNSDYSEKTETYVMTVTNTDPNAPGTENNPYSVAEAIAATPASGTSANVYIKGIVSAFYKTSIMGDGSNYRYYISDDGDTDNQLLVYKGKGLNNVAFSDADDLQLGDVVTILGGLTTYSNAPEVAANNYIVSRVEKSASDLSKTSDIALDFKNADLSANVADHISSSSEGAYTYESADETIATVTEEGVVTGLKVGSTTITVNQAATPSYKAGTIEIPVTVADTRVDATTIPAINISSLTDDAEDGTISVVDPVKADEGVTFSFSSSNEDVLLIEDDQYIVGEIGTTTVTVTATASNSDLYKDVTATFEVTVNAAVKSENVIETAFDSNSTVYDTKLEGLVSGSEGFDGVITAESSNTSVLTVAVDSEGNVTVTPVAVGTATVTFSAAGTAYFLPADDVQQVFTVTAPEGSTTAPASGFAKVTATENITDGEYLIVYEDANVAFDGSLETLDVTDNTIEVEINDGVIAATNTTTAATFTINTVAGTLQSMSGYYIGKTANSNGLDSNTETQYTNTFEIDGAGNAVITASGGCVLKYNSASNQNRFRYYKSGQQDIQLYKLSNASETVTLNKYGYATYCSVNPMDFSATEGYTAWRISSIDMDGTTGTINCEKITDAIKGGQGVLLYNKNAGGAKTNVTVTFADGTKEFTTSENLLIGTTAPTFVEAGEVYGLVGDEFVPSNADGVMPAGKAYLEATSIPANVKAFTFVFNDDATGITETRKATREEVESIFNLGGQRMSKMQRGVNIVNGKKVLVK